MDARCKLLVAEAISDDEVSVLYESNILGISSAEA